MSTKSTVLALAAALLLLIPVFSVLFSHDAHAITSSLFVSQSIKNINGKATQQINAGQQAMISVSVLNYDKADQPFTAIIDVRDDSNVSVHVEWVSGVAAPGGQTEAKLLWTAQDSGSYSVRTFVITGFENPEVISRVSSSHLMVTNSATLKDTFVPGNLTGISKFAAISSGGQYTVWFTLVDKNGKQTTYDGKATITITDSLGEQRYSRTFAVAKNDFVLFKPDSSAANIAYVSKVSMLDVNRGLGTGTAVLTFTDSDGKIYYATFGPIEIYQVSGNQLAQDYEQKYIKIADNVGKVVVKENLKITLAKSGHFTHLANGTSGDDVTHYRADLTIENLGTTINSWPSRYVFIDDKSNEYDAIGGTLHTGDAVPGFGKISGYLLFDDMSEGASWGNLILRGSNYSVDPKDYFEFHIRL
jgi:hypothetical protein